MKLVEIRELRDGSFSLEFNKSSDMLTDLAYGVMTFITLSEKELEAISEYLRQYLLDRTIQKLGEPI